MNIRWNQSATRFEAEFSEDFQGDLNAVKEAGFKTDGPPNWVWYTSKIGILNRLRTSSRPPSGLTIDNEALAIYTPLNEIEEKSAEIKRQAAAKKKELAKERDSGEAHNWLPEGKEYLSAEDFPLTQLCLPNLSSDVLAYNGPNCVVCGGPIELPHNPPICLWCEKELDKASLI